VRVAPCGYAPKGVAVKTRKATKANNPVALVA
jgi:hypothetical protein